MTSSGMRRSSASSAARVIDSPTAPPMLPPMNSKSMPATTSRLTVDRAGAVEARRTSRPTFFCAAAIRSG